MLNEDVTRWQRGLLRQVRTLHPDQLSVELTARRYRHRLCFEALVERTEALVRRDPATAWRLAEEAERWVDRHAPEDPQLRICVLGLVGESRSACGEASRAKASFREALRIDTSPTPEVGALWWKYALYLVEHEAKALESLEWATRSVELFLAIGERRRGRRDRASLAAAWLARGRVGWWARESASNVARCYLASALEATETTARSGLEACQALAWTAPVAWMSEDAGLHPWKVLRRLERLDRRFRRGGQSKHSPCRCRVRGLQGLALAHLGHGLTPQSESYLSEAKAALLREGSMSEVAWLNLDLSYILLWEGRWTELAKMAQETLDLLVGEQGRSAGARRLEAWQASLGRRRMEPSAWRAAYREVRGVRAPLILPETEARDGPSTWVSGW